MPDPEQVVAERLAQFDGLLPDDVPDPGGFIAHQLTDALREAGWSLVRLDDCVKGEVLLFQAADGTYQSAVFPAEGRHAFDDLPLRSTYALVPLPSPEDTGGDE